MATRPLPPPRPDPTKSTNPTNTSKQPTLEAVRVANNPPALKKSFNWIAKSLWMRIAIIAALIFLVILVAIPFLINVNRFRPKIESEASAALGRKVEVGNLSLSILSGSVGAENIAIADDPAFSKSPFVKAKSLRIGIALMPLIFSKQLNVTDITLDAPQITLLRTVNGKWNFSSIGGTSTQKAPASSKPGGPPTENFSIAKLNVNDGQLLIGKANSSTKPVVYNDVNISVKNFSFATQFPFQLTAQLPGKGDLSISGNAGPRCWWCRRWPGKRLT